MIVKTPDLGQDVDAYCSRCKFVLAHTVLAKLEQTIKRVRCNTCKAEHVFRNAPGARATRSKKSTTGTTARPRTKALASNYATLMSGHDPDLASNYSPRLCLVVSDVIRHAKFGIGVVSAVKAGDKAEVVFPDATRVLVHNRG